MRLNPLAAPLADEQTTPAIAGFLLACPHQACFPLMVKHRRILTPLPSRFWGQRKSDSWRVGVAREGVVPGNILTGHFACPTIPEDSSALRTLPTASSAPCPARISKKNEPQFGRAMKPPTRPAFPPGCSTLARLVSDLLNHPARPTAPTTRQPASNQSKRNPGTA